MYKQAASHEASREAPPPPLYTHRRRRRRRCRCRHHPLHDQHRATFASRNCGFVRHGYAPHPTCSIDEYDNEQVRLFQNTHRLEDLAPMWVLNESDRTLLCPPGTCGRYSSTNFIILGLVIGQHTAAPDWDQVDQGVWYVASLGVLRPRGVACGPSGGIFGAASCDIGPPKKPTKTAV